MPPLDKQAHFLAGAAISSFVYILSGNLSLALNITAIVAALWEILGIRWGRECSLADFLYTMAGCFMPVFAIIINNLKN